MHEQAASDCVHPYAFLALGTLTFVLRQQTAMLAVIAAGCINVVAFEHAHPFTAFRLSFGFSNLLVQVDTGDRTSDCGFSGQHARR